MSETMISIRQLAALKDVVNRLQFHEQIMSNANVSIDNLLEHVSSIIERARSLNENNLKDLETDVAKVEKVASEFAKIVTLLITLQHGMSSKMDVVLGPNLVVGDGVDSVIPLKTREQVINEKALSMLEELGSDWADRYSITARGNPSDDENFYKAFQSSLKRQLSSIDNPEHDTLYTEQSTVDSPVVTGELSDKQAGIKKSSKSEPSSLVADFSDAKAIGRMFARARKDEGLTQAALAKRLEWTERRVRAFEAGDGNFTRETYEVVAEKIGRPLKLVM